MTQGFYLFFNRGGAEGGGGSKRLGGGWRAVWAQIEGRYARVLDWSTGDVARVSAKEFAAVSRPDRPRITIVRRNLKRLGARGPLPAAARRG